MDQRPRQFGAHRPNRRRQELAGLGARPQGVSRQPLGPLSTGAPALRALALARGDGRHSRLLRGLGRVDLLILDDWGLEPLDAAARHDLLAILEDRYGHRSTTVPCQLPVDQWHALVGDPTYADAVLDRLVHNAHSINLNGESL